MCRLLAVFAKEKSGFRDKEFGHSRLVSDSCPRACNTCVEITDYTTHLVVVLPRRGETEIDIFNNMTSCSSPQIFFSLLIITSHFLN